MRRHVKEGIKLPFRAVTEEQYYKLKNTKFCIFSDRDNGEHKSPWFYSYERAKQALKIIQGKGYKAIIWVD